MQRLLAVGASPSLLNVITLSAVSLLLYMGGMVTNDLFDIQVDTQEAEDLSRAVVCV